MTRWAILTGEYPPQPGGVSDYTHQLAEGLARAGERVTLYAPCHPGCGEETSSITVRRLPDRFGPRGLRWLDSELNRERPDRILVQYVPHAYGWRAMNVPFVLWLLWRRKRRGDEILVMYHEVAFPWVALPLRHNLIAAVNRAMAAILLRACTKAYVSIPGWLPILKRLGAGSLTIRFTPVPANVPDDVFPGAISLRRANLTSNVPEIHLVGHFGTYGDSVTTILGPVLRDILTRCPEVRIILLGSGGRVWRDELIGDRVDWRVRVIAPGELPASLVSEYLSACDLAFQPYPEGASCRRGSLMAALANRVPVVTTIGALSEPIWSEGAVAVSPVDDFEALSRSIQDLLDRPDHRAQLGESGRQLYEERFALRHTIAALMEPPCPSPTDD